MSAAKTCTYHDYMGHLDKDKDCSPPRRIRLDKFTPAEKAIYDAMKAVEALPPNVKLTEAVILLDKARELVADFVDHYSE